jgi:hypothetical protein
MSAALRSVDSFRDATPASVGLIDGGGASELLNKEASFQVRGREGKSRCFGGRGEGGARAM